MSAVPMLARAASPAEPAASPLSSLAEREALILRLRAAIGLRDPSAAPGRPARLPGRLPTGFPALDEALGGGLCSAALNEIHVAAAGSGALEALLPCLARAGRDDFSPSLAEREASSLAEREASSLFAEREALPRASPKQRLLAWIHPGRTPYPPALVQHGFDLRRWLIVRPPDEDGHLWALDQALRSAACDAVVAFAGDVPDRMLRRLQLAAEGGSTLALLMRPAALAPRPSPAALRLLVEPLPARDLRRRRIRVTILKARGLAAPPAAVEVEWSRDPLAG